MQVFMVFVNADLTEGRGPMIPHECFATYELAAEYIDNRPGIQGIRGKWSAHKHNGHWEIREFEVLTTFPDESTIEKWFQK